MKIAIIGAGISGLSAARMLQAKGHDVTIFEAAATVGGLVKCSKIDGAGLFHRVGGHVFNSRNQAVLDWFWEHFDRDQEFIKAQRNAKIWFDNALVGYPIENYLWQLKPELVTKIVAEQLQLQAESGGHQRSADSYPDFEAFLKGNFGQTLYDVYFGPYNTKIWNTDLSKVPLPWLEGKLPMPNLLQMLLSNIIKAEEGNMVHAIFYYAKEGGSQFIANRLAEGLKVKTSYSVRSLDKDKNGWVLNGVDHADAVVFTGNVRLLGNLAPHTQSGMHASRLPALKANGTSNLFCYTDATDVSWLYLPDAGIQAHRIIYTGNFSPGNNYNQRTTCVVEFSGEHTREFMEAQIKQLPGNLEAIDHNYESHSYVIQDADTRQKIANAKLAMEKEGMYLLGRFAEWEYYNMDKAIEASMALAAKL